MVKRDLISGAQIKTSFTKPGERESLSRTEAALDWMDWARALFALIATLALIVGVAYGARRLGMMQANGQGVKRLRVTESLMLDPRRRMVIVRCDEREHLILLGPGGDIIVGDMAAKDQPVAESQT